MIKKLYQKHFSRLMKHCVSQGLGAVWGFLIQGFCIEILQQPWWVGFFCGLGGSLANNYLLNYYFVYKKEVQISLTQDA